jgi:hypothetical protein
MYESIYIYHKIWNLYLTPFNNNFKIYIFSFNIRRFLELSICRKISAFCFKIIYLPGVGLNVISNGSFESQKFWSLLLIISLFS